jgi:hypothetical protein
LIISNNKNNMKKINFKLIALALLVVASPVFASAATYAYVDQAGEVKTVVANDPYAAMATAFNIDEHSGVMLIVNPADGIIGDHVPSV